MPQYELEISSASKPIHCIVAEPDKGKQQDGKSPTKPSLIFTHGAGGTLASDGIANFMDGFAHQLPILCFQGNMNLKSRVKMFGAVIEDQDFATTLGGRSMGARAAIMAATRETKYLVLVSYPLHTGKEVRDQALLDINSPMHVIFVSGDKDSMCDLARLEQVRKKMRCTTWRIVVQGADHGMNVKPKKATTAVGNKIGEVVAEWIENCDTDYREGRISCDEEGDVQWTGWTAEIEVLNGDTKAVEAPASKPDKGPKRSRVDTDAVSSRTRKSRKHDFSAGML